MGLKILFLDIDGVLNGHDYDGVAQSCMIDRDCVLLLNQIYTQTGCEVVLSSAWRYMVLNGSMTLSGFGYMMRTHGVAKDLIFRDTLPLDTQLEQGYARGDAILEYLKYQTPGAQWVAVDDLGIFRESCSRFVRTDGKVGLTDERAHVIIRLLNQRCSCGSGGHPRKCEIHPNAFQNHIAELEKIQKEEE